ncbi:hypothetical protein B566_EDAN019342, partial [Ephemera danica]
MSRHITTGPSFEKVMAVRQHSQTDTPVNSPPASFVLSRSRASSQASITLPSPSVAMEWKRWLVIRLSSFSVTGLEKLAPASVDRAKRTLAARIFCGTIWIHDSMTVPSLATAILGRFSPSTAISSGSGVTGTGVEKVGKPDLLELKKRLSAEQFAVTQRCSTEPPFRNAYWNNYKPGLYVDIVSGEPLFSSMDKFDSSTGWPSFTRPLAGTGLVEKPDHELGMERTEVRSKQANSHLGH